MIGDSLLPLKKACYAALTGSSGFMALVTGVFDQEAPVSQAFNYVVIGAGTQLPFNTLGKSGRECTITFDIFTESMLGAADGEAITGSLITTLAQQNLTLSTTPAQTCVYVDLDNYSDRMDDGELPAYHGSARLLFRTQEV